MDPSVKAGYEVLARIHEESSAFGRARRTWERYLDVVPQSLAAKEAVAKLQADDSAGDR